MSEEDSTGNREVRPRISRIGANSFFHLPSPFCSSGLRFQVSAFFFLLFLLAGALLWARGRDPFERRWFKVHPAGAPAAECVAILPKMAAWPLPVVVWLHGSGGSVTGSGDEMRQMAEMGLTVVGLEYCQTNQASSEAQFLALLDYLGRQGWADTNRVAWAGYSLGAQRELAFFLRHPERQPKLLVRRAGGWIPELESKVQSLKSKVQSPKPEPEQLIADSPRVDGPAFVGLPPPSDFGETSRRGKSPMSKV
jgi:pimeloyl-ACP methyl ester carboxylesterase